MKKLQKIPWALLASALWLSGSVVGGETSEPKPAYAEAIQAVMAADHRLGTIRNHASEDAPIARAVEAYVAGLDALDLGQCPQDFVQALTLHRNAWHDAIGFFEQYSELRGELHDVFEAIRGQDDTSRAGLEAVEADIWGTWAEVEASMKKYPKIEP